MIGIIAFLVLTLSAEVDSGKAMNDANIVANIKRDIQEVRSRSKKLAHKALRIEKYLTTAERTVSKAEKRLETIADISFACSRKQRLLEKKTDIFVREVIKRDVSRCQQDVEEHANERKEIRKRLISIKQHVKQLRVANKYFKDDLKSLNERISKLRALLNKYEPTR